MFMWAVRKATLTSLVHVLRAKSSSTAAEVDLKDKAAKYTSCLDWQEHEKAKFTSAITNLVTFEATVRTLQYTKQGRRIEATTALRFWTAHDDQAFVPDELTPPSNMGISWETVGGGLSSVGSGVRTMSLSDLEDLLVSEHPHLVNSEQNMSYQAGRSGDQSADSALRGSYHRHCAGRRSKVVSFVSRHGHSLDVVACCAHDYGDVFQALSTVMLYQAMVRKLNSAATGATKPALATSGAGAAVSVCQACVSAGHSPLNC